jgi:hypothetical protein
MAVLDENVKYVFIVLPEQRSYYYEELAITWSETVSHDKGKFTGRYMFDNNFLPMNVSRYVDVQLDQRYQFVKFPEFHYFDFVDFKFTTYMLEEDIPSEERGVAVLEDRRRFVYRFGLLAKATFGLALGEGAIPVLYFLWILPGTTAFQFAATLAVGVVAVMVALRASLFQYETIFYSGLIDIKGGFLE